MTEATPRLCAERLYTDPRWVGGEPCQLLVQVLENGKWWCGTHSKSAKARRRAKSSALYERDRAKELERVDREHETRRRASHFVPLMEALEELQRLAWGDVSGHSIAAYEEAKTMARAALDAAREATP